MKILLLIMGLFFIVPLKNGTINKNLNHENLYNIILEYDVKYPDIAFAQALLESGNFTSKLCKTQNNLFGMKMPYRRETTAIGKNKSGYAKYSSWHDSVEDYLLFQKFVMRKKNMTRDEYMSYIGKHYAADKKYLTKIKQKIKEYKTLFI